MFRLLSLTNFTGRPRTETNTLPPEHFKVVDYALDWRGSCLRLSLSYQHMVVHLLVRRSSVPDGERIPFETLLFDTVEQTWSENHRTSPIGWCRRDLEEIEQPAQVYKLEEDLYSKVKEIVPALLEGRNCPGAQLFAKLETEFGTDKIHAILIGDIFQDIMAPCLPVLSPENCKDLRKMDS
ncbi:unnamed protein product [Tilletia laevis]|nr:unnamed protein product [Tilletia laevis]